MLLGVYASGGPMTKDCILLSLICPEWPAAGQLRSVQMICKKPNICNEYLRLTFCTYHADGSEHLWPLCKLWVWPKVLKSFIDWMLKLSHISSLFGFPSDQGIDIGASSRLISIVTPVGSGRSLATQPLLISPWYNRAAGQAGKSSISCKGEKLLQLEKDKTLLYLSSIYGDWRLYWGVGTEFLLLLHLSLSSVSLLFPPTGHFLHSSESQAGISCNPGGSLANVTKYI